MRSTPVGMQGGAVFPTLFIPEYAGFGQGRLPPLFALLSLAKAGIRWPLVLICVHLRKSAADRLRGRMVEELEHSRPRLCLVEAQGLVGLGLSPD